MRQENTPIRNYEFDVEDDHGPESDLVTFPASVQRKLDEGAARIREGDVRDGLSLVHEAGVELSRSDPLLFAGLLAAQVGVAGLRAYRRGGNRKTTEEERFTFGVRTGHSRQTTTEEFFEERGVDFGPGFPGKGERRW